MAKKFEIRKPKDAEKVDPKANDNRKLWPRITRSTPPKKDGK